MHCWLKSSKSSRLSIRIQNNISHSDNLYALLA